MSSILLSNILFTLNIFITIYTYLTGHMAALFLLLPSHVLAVLFLLQNLVAGEDCQEELQKVSKCMTVELENSTQIAIVSTNELTDDFKKCFADADCEYADMRKVTEKVEEAIPKELISRLNELRRRLAGPQPFSAATIDAASQCSVRLRDQWQAPLQDCLSNAEQPSFLPSQSNRFFSFLTSRDRHSLTQRAVINEAARIVYEICPSSDKREKAKKCMSAAVDRRMPLNQIDDQFALIDRTRYLCNVRTNCHATLSEKCVKVAEETPKVTCKCIARVMDANFDQMIAAMRSCIRNSTGKFLGLIDNPLFSTVFKKMARRIMTQLCSNLQSAAFDPCQSTNALSPFNIHSKHVQVHEIIHVHQLNLPVGFIQPAAN